MPLDDRTCLGVYISSIFMKAAEVRGGETVVYPIKIFVLAASVCMLVVRKDALRRSATGFSVYPKSSAYCRLKGAGNIGHRCLKYLYSFTPLQRYLEGVASSHNTLLISVLICNKKAYCFVRIIRALEALSYNSHQSRPSVFLPMCKSFNNHVPLNSRPPGVPEDNHLLKNNIC